MAKKILIMGLPGAGKTTLAMALKRYIESKTYEPTVSEAEMLPIFTKISVDWFNADDIRKKFNDWDFSRDGRIRQSIRMSEFALGSFGQYVICDFVAPLVEMRNNFKADWTIWVDTIEQSKYDDTNKAFIPPDIYDFRIIEQDAEKWAEYGIVSDTPISCTTESILCKSGTPVPNVPRRNCPNILP